MVAAASALVKVVTVPSVSESVNVPVTPPLRVRSSEPGSGTHPFFAALAVKWIASPSSRTTSTAVSEIRRTWL